MDLKQKSVALSPPPPPLPPSSVRALRRPLSTAVPIHSPPPPIPSIINFDIRHPIHPALRLNRKYERALNMAGTLANGRVYVAVSTLVTGCPMLGLFAGERIAKKEVITLYGGVHTFATALKGVPPQQRSHVIRIKESDWVMDGGPFAAFFPIRNPNDPGLNDAYADEMKQPARLRTHVYPIGGTHEVMQQIRMGGIGYMANQPNRNGKANAQMEAMERDMNRGIGVRSLVYIATEDIPAHAEILIHYRRSERMDTLSKEERVEAKKARAEKTKEKKAEVTAMIRDHLDEYLDSL